MHSSTSQSPFALVLEYAQSIQLVMMAGQERNDQLRRLESATLVEPLHAMLLGAKDSFREAHNSQMVKVNRRCKPCTFEGADCVIVSMNDLPMTYANKDFSWRNVQHLWAGQYKMIKFCGPNTAQLE